MWLKSNLAEKMADSAATDSYNGNLIWLRRSVDSVEKKPTAAVNSLDAFELSESSKERRRKIEIRTARKLKT